MSQNFRLTKDGDFDTASMALALKIPVVADVTLINVAPEGSIVLDDATKVIYVSIGTAWVSTGDISGPALSTNNAAAIYDGVTGQVLKNSALIVNGTTSSIATFDASTSVKTDSILEHTANAGVTVDGTLIKDTSVTTNSITLQTTGGATQGALNYYENFSYAAVWVYSLTNTNTTFYLTRLGDIVVLRIPAFTFNTAASAVFNLDGATPIPSRFRPSVQVSFPINVISAGVGVIGTIAIASSGASTIYGGAFTSGGNPTFNVGDVGIPIDQVVTWSVI